jgi:hypothetical protein
MQYTCSQYLLIILRLSLKLVLIKWNNIYIKIVILFYWIVILYSLSWWFYISFCVWFSWSARDVCAIDVGQTACWAFSFLYCLDYTCLVQSFLSNSLYLVICFCYGVTYIYTVPCGCSGVVFLQRYYLNSDNRSIYFLYVFIHYYFFLFSFQNKHQFF